ncbi:squalene/phytoene synthase family protein [Microbacterium sp. CFH 90308]|uniref:Squalene/phytoene synthase family protein n=1 Tax=Microbacterium salsuginis TaxID=2722803 RepID=A0ABX1KH73_9MICO|nr:squalene/phytoene synthase family protein [Microbacterium sp. CFH 90308]NLP85822.1 squalene/phytoene synthase family protein [Microbacterium sp. CFH 90308]
MSLARRRRGGPTGLALYDETARDAAATVIARYSTSFSLACRLLGPRPRPHVRSVYALVRIADEIVDGPARTAGLDDDVIRAVLDDLEHETLAAIGRGYSANLVVHAFAATARECGIDERLVGPFFTSMRTDLSTSRHDRASHDAYVYGSAEVVGLMCLRVFVNAGAPRPLEPSATLTEGARRLGAAFQEVNFLRDLDHDATALGRDYLGLDPRRSRTAVLDRIDADLAAAAATIPFLPPDCRRAVTAAHDLFAELSTRLRADDGDLRRVRVPDSVKARLAARAWLGFAPRAARA